MSLSKHCLPYNLSYWDWESSSKSLGMPVVQRVILQEANTGVRNKYPPLPHCITMLELRA